MKMTENQAADCASYVMQRLKATDIAVFKIKSIYGRDGNPVEIVNAVKTLFPGGARFELMCAEYPEAFVGVYTLKGTYREQIVQDIKETPGVAIKKILSSL